jgi:signal transduction histidine kinase
MSHKLSIPAWHKPYSQAFLETDPEILVKLLAATEKAVFERLLELTANEDASDERQDIRRAIDVILTLKTRADSKTSFVGSPGVGLIGMRDRVTALGGNFEIVSSGKGTIVKVVIPLQEPAHQMV